jgi:ribosomal protein S18 acetylase RimI-like enzyme
MSENIKIRPMVERDMAAVDDIDHVLTAKGRVTSWPFSFETYWRMYAKGALAFVAEMDGKVCGFLSGYIEKEDRSKVLMGRPHEVNPAFAEEWTGWIEMMGIRPEVWHKGIGTRLIDAFRTECKKKNAPLRINAREDDTDLVAFLKRAGFKPSKIRTFEEPV